MYISDFNYHKPGSLSEACKLLEKSENGAVIAGGTDLLVEIKQGLRHHQDIVSLTEIKELKFISEDKDNLFIGACITHNELAGSPVIKKNFPAIAEAANTIGTEQIRNTATIGGNLCTGASSCDMAPILIALNASVEIASLTKVRTVSLKNFFTFHKKTCIKKGEIITKIIIPQPKPYTGAYFEKFGLRNASSISVASVGAMLKFKKVLPFGEDLGGADNTICDEVCIVIGAVAPTPKISDKANKLIKGRKLTELSENSSILKQAGEAAADDSLPIDDIRGSAEYRKDIIKVLMQRAVIKVVERVNKILISRS